jgi:hypothetical protein
MSLLASSPPHYLAVVTLLDQLDPKELNWSELLRILGDRLQSPSDGPQFGLHAIFGGMKPHLEFLEFSGTAVKFLTDRDRAGSLWVNPQMYVNLATQLFKILHDK